MFIEQVLLCGKMFQSSASRLLYGFALSMCCVTCVIQVWILSRLVHRFVFLCHTSYIFRCNWLFVCVVFLCEPKPGCLSWTCCKLSYCWTCNSCKMFYRCATSFECFLLGVDRHFLMNLRQSSPLRRKPFIRVVFKVCNSIT